MSLKVILEIVVKMSSSYNRRNMFSFNSHFYEEISLNNCHSTNGEDIVQISTQLIELPVAYISSEILGPYKELGQG